MRDVDRLIEQAKVHHQQGQLDQAEALCRQVLARQPYNIDAMIMLGHLAREHRQLDQAIVHFRAATNIRASDARAWYGLAATLHERGELQGAAEACRRVIQLRPEVANAYTNLGTLMSQMGFADEAVLCFQTATALDPRDASAHADLLYSLYFHHQVLPERMLQEHQHWAQRHADHLTALAPPHENVPDPDRALRVGYVSGDFRTHSVGYFFEPLLEAHDRQQVHVTCYAASREVDEVTRRLQQRADRWREIAKVSDEQAAQFIRADGIDILIDLSGHTGLNRMLLFARRPAPVQATYLGYPGTTGLGAIQYRLTDCVADPPSLTESHYRETLLRVEPPAWCYRPPDHAPEPTDGPGELSFGSFNRIGKTNEPLIRLWARILNEVPGSRLIMKSEGLDQPMSRERFGKWFSDAGIAPDRVELHGRADSVDEHLGMYQRISIALDTFPYNGTTTTCEAMWMCVPVITLAGDAHRSRVGASLLGAAGLADLVASTSDEYVAKAVALARDETHRSALRRTLRDNMRASPLMDGKRLAREVERVLRDAWRRWCGERTA